MLYDHVESVNLGVKTLGKWTVLGANMWSQFENADEAGMHHALTYYHTALNKGTTLQLYDKNFIIIYNNNSHLALSQPARHI